MIAAAIQSPLAPPQPRTAAIRLTRSRASITCRSGLGRRSVLPCRTEASKGGQGLTERLAANFDSLVTEIGGKQYISVDELLNVCGMQRGEVAEALGAAVRYAQDLRASEAGQQAQGGPTAVHAAVHRMLTMHEAHEMDLKEMMEFASQELEPKEGPSPALQLAMRQLRDRISDKLDKHVSAAREVEDLRRLVEAQAACEEAQAAAAGAPELSGEETARD